MESVSSKFKSGRGLREVGFMYKILRMIKNKNYKSIVVEKIPNIGFGEVINDRLKRASAK